jgi:hypothetical protein
MQRATGAPAPPREGERIRQRNRPRPPEVLYPQLWWNGESPRLVISLAVPIDAPAELAEARRSKNQMIGIIRPAGLFVWPR